MNFTQGTKLAILQENLKDAYLNNLPIDSNQLQNLKDNIWVKTAYCSPFELGNSSTLPN